MSSGNEHKSLDAIRTSKTSLSCRCAACNSRRRYSATSRSAAVCIHAGDARDLCRSEDTSSRCANLNLVIYHSNHRPMLSRQNRQAIKHFEPKAIVPSEEALFMEQAKPIIYLQLCEDDLAHVFVVNGFSSAKFKVRSRTGYINPGLPWTRFFSTSNWRLFRQRMPVAGL